MRFRTAIAAAGLALSIAGFVAADGGGSSGTSARSPQPVAGAELFVAKGCAACHDGPDTRSEVDMGPTLAAAADWAGRRRPGMDADAYLAESMTDPAAFISPGTVGDGEMPVLAFDRDEVERLVVYLLGR